MSERNLRQGTRKDYAGMDAELSDEYSSDGTSAIKVAEKGFAEASDGELEDMEARLEVLQLENEKIKKAQKYRRISEETRRLEESLEKFREEEMNEKTSKLNLKELRKMKHVVKEADRQLEETLGLKKKTSKSKGKKKQESDDGESSDSESSEERSERKKRKKVSKKNKKRVSKFRESEEESSSRSSDTESSDEDIDSDDDDESVSSSEGEKSRKKTNRKKKRSSKKKKSGKDEKLTSSVKYPQKWPHAHLGQQFVNKTKKYEDLSLAEFCAGYTSILRKINDQKKLKYRLEHFENLMYLSTRYQWRSVLSYHAAVLLEIERGNKKWSGCFRDLENTTLAGSFPNNGGVSNNNNTSRQQRSQQGRNDSAGPPVLFCRNFQRGTCTQSHDHNGMFEGKSQLLRHICAECWLKSKKMEAHPETYENCPYKDEER